MDVEFKYQCSVKEQNLELAGLYPSVKDAIMTIAKKEGYISHKIHKNMISSVGGNCLGILYEVNITGETTEGNKETNIFVKQVIPNADSFKLIPVTEIYNKEAFIYKELSSIFTELQNRAKIPIKDRFKFVKNFDVNSADAILLENVSKQGFKTYNRMDVMNINYAEVCVQQLAKFHSLAFLTEKQMPKYFESKIKSLKHSIEINAYYKSFMSKVYESATRKLAPNLKIKIDEWWETGLEYYSNCINGKMTDVKCLCHGDFKMNNILYKEIDGKVTEVIAIDYQLIHYGSPILDFIYFICMATDQEFRRQYIRHLKDYYHDSLKTHLEHFNVNVDNVYPKKTFEKDFEDCVLYGVVCCIMILPFVLTTEEGIEVTDDKIVREGLTLDDRYYNRLQGVLDDYLHFAP